MRLVQLLLLVFHQLLAMGKYLPEVGPKVEYAAHKIRLLPKTIKRTPFARPAITTAGPEKDRPRTASKKAASGRVERHKPIYNSDSLYSATSATRVQRPRDRNGLAKKVETTLLYRPKFPAYPEFKMCRLEDFDISRSTKLGKGGFGNVFLGSHRDTGIPVAIKFIPHDSIRKSPKHVEFEETIHGRLHHPWISKFYCTMADAETSDIFFVLEYIKGVNLAKKIAAEFPVPHGLIQRWTAEIILAMEYLHDNCIVYRDMKAENIMIDHTDHVKVVDFGLSRFDCHNELENVAGTLEYTAPEMASRSPHGRPIDYYGIGTLLFTMKMGRLPLSFKTAGMEKTQYLEYIAETFRMPSTRDELYDDLIAHLCERNPETRWGVTPESRKLVRKHRFFDGIDWVDLQKRVSDTRPHTPFAADSIEAIKDGVPLKLYISSGELRKQVLPTK